MRKRWETLKSVLERLRTAWAIVGITMIVLLGMELGFRLLFTIRDHSSSESVPDRRVLEAGYGGERWPIQHYRELEMLEDRWEPYVYFRQKPFRAETITIGQDGLRATWMPPSPAPPRQESPASSSPTAKILMLGGSSLWGYGARDDQTIPSLIAKRLSQRGIAVQIRNLAEIGYVSTQEVVALVRELQSGCQPDLVIFYDGVNDTTSALLEGQAGITTNEINRRREFNLLQSPARLGRSLLARLVEASGSFRFARSVRQRLVGSPAVGSREIPPHADLPALAADVIRRYVANLELITRLGREYGFRCLFYWQPVIFGKTKRTSFESEEAARFAWAEAMFRAVNAALGTSAELRKNPNFHDLSNQFATADSLLFIDYCHTTEIANDQLAATIVPDVESLLKTSQPR